MTEKLDVEALLERLSVFVQQHYEPADDSDYELKRQLDAARSIHCFPETERVKAWAALRMVRDAVGELFGPAASIESEEAVLLRGPEYHHEAEAIVDSLRSLSAERDRLAARLVEAERVIEPFATEADLWDGYSDDELLVEGWSGGPASSLDISDLRCARDFMKGVKRHEDH